VRPSARAQAGLTGSESGRWDAAPRRLYGQALKFENTKAAYIQVGHEIGRQRCLHIERALKLRIERKRVTRGAAVSTCRNTLTTRTLTAMPGEQFA
jgi:hypothetical protein